MAKIQPFAAIRPADAYCANVAALPYDVYDRKEAREYALAHPLSFLNIDRPETQFEPDHDIYADDVYEKASEMIQEFLEKGIFVREKQKAFYLYELTMNGRSQTGLVVCAGVDDYLDGTIRRHENTRADKEADRIRHVDRTGMQTGPIFLAYRAIEEVSALITRIKEEKCDFDFTSEDGIRHRGWTIADPEKIGFLQKAFEDRILYIADGHHRAASAVKAALMRRERHPGFDGTEEFNSFLSVLFPDNELMIMDYNRIVTDLGGLSPEEFLTQLEKVCEVTQKDAIVRPAGKGQFGLYTDGHHYLCSFRDEYLSSDPVKGLDVSILQDHVLGPILKIGDPKVDERILFMGGIRGLEALTGRAEKEGGVSFAMYPTSIGELFRVADASMLMPPKSTWFEPKLRSGLFLHDIGQ